MNLDVYVVDAFTDKPFCGNPAAVVPTAEPLTDDLMRSIASEMNLSETAFVVTGGDPGEPKSLRWFTPTDEVELCGHATLATTHVLGGSHQFQTLSGVLTCEAKDGGWVQMDFPADQPSPIEVEGVDDAIGVDVVELGAGGWVLVAQVGSQTDLENLKPDMTAIAVLPKAGLLVTAVADDAQFDFVSRCFFPSIGVPEDPVTGSAHCALTCWWSARMDKSEFVAKQLSRRTGIVRTRLDGDRVHLLGQAVTVTTGQLHLD